jgi:hypothetical protein
MRQVFAASSHWRRHCLPSVDVPQRSGFPVSICGIFGVAHAADDPIMTMIAIRFIVVCELQQTGPAHRVNEVGPLAFHSRQALATGGKRLRNQ